MIVVLGSEGTVLISLFGFSTISVGAFLGEPTPNHWLAAQHELTHG